MITGAGVQVKYTTIIEGREYELFQSVKTPIDAQIASEMLMDFRDEIRACTHSQFNEWYELYKDYKPIRAHAT